MNAIKQITGETIEDIVIKKPDYKETVEPEITIITNKSKLHIGANELGVWLIDFEKKK